MTDLINKIKRIFRSMDPLFWVFLAILIAERLLNGTDNIGQALIEKLLMLPGIIIGITFHEAGHAFASYKLGDPTPKAQGRLSLNPAAHIDPLGFIFLFVAGFGWGRPVQINPMYYKNKRRDEFIVSIAGVTVNLVLMVFNLIPCPPLDGWGILTQIFDLRKYSWWYPVYSRGSLILMALIIFNVTDIVLSPIVTKLYQLFLL